MLDVESLLAENMGCILFYFVPSRFKIVLFYGSVISLMLSDACLLILLNTVALSPDQYGGC
jgi:hypothetical protein